MLRDDRAAALTVENWFAANARDLPWRRDHDPWEVLVAEVMSQQTRMEVVVHYHQRFLERYPTPADLAAADVDEVLALWSGLGYYTRARNLVRAAIEICERFDGEVPGDYEKLLTLPGIGPYTAGAVHSIAFDGRSAVVDGNVSRLAARTARLTAEWRSTRLEKAARKWSADLLEECESPRMLNQGLMELGSTICRPTSPLCGECCLAGQCGALLHQEVEEFPVPRARREVVRMKIPLLVVRGSRDDLLTLRTTGGELMRGLFHLPHGNAKLIESLAIAEWRSVRMLGAFSHSITNRRIRFEIHEAEIDPGFVADSSEMEFVSSADLRALGIPSYVRKALDIVESTS